MTTGNDNGGQWLEVDRFRSRPDGLSEFVRARIPWAHIVPGIDPSGAAARMSDSFASPNVKLLQIPGGMAQEAHPAPEPQFVVVLSGRIEVETTGDRLIKSWGAGEFFIASDHDGIGAQMGLRRVRTLALNSQLKLIGRSHHGAGDHAHCASRCAGPVVHAENGFHRALLEQALIHHALRPACAFFGRLKNHIHGSVEITIFSEVMGSAQ